MSYQKKRNIVYLISTLLIFWFFWLYVFQRYLEGSLNSTNVFSFWGSAILLLIPAQIVVNIILHIVFSIINKIATNEECEPSLTDERDQLIELKATRNSYYLFIVGFLLSMGTLVINMPPFVMFNMLVFSLFAAQIIEISSKFYYY